MVKLSFQGDRDFIYLNLEAIPFLMILSNTLFHRNYLKKIVVMVYILSCQFGISLDLKY